MALKNLQSNLTNLRWGNDTPGGGDSGLPYIKTSLPQNSTAIERIAFESARFSSDFPIRGGLYSVRAAAEDAIRIRKFLTDFPKGSNFTQKQVGLQKSNPLIETGENGGRINTRTYNLNSNLLFSTLQAGTGNYYPRAGATPFTLLEEDNKYFSIVGKKPTEENRLYNLWESKINKNINSFKLESLGISLFDSQIMSYDGGPNSFYGVGETTTFRATDNKGVPIDTSNPFIEPISRYILLPNISSLSQFGPTFYLKNDNISDGDLGIQDNKIILNPNNVLKSTKDKISKLSSKLDYIITDFRNSGSIDGEKTFSRDYNMSGRDTIKMENRIGIGSPGLRPREKRISINDNNDGIGQDKINMTPIYYGDIAPENTNEDVRDLIKFNFETIDNNDTSLTNTYRTHFRAYLKGFSDNNSAEWSDKRYAGRGDKMYTYQGFDRNISFNFTVVAHSKQEMKPLWQKLNYLTSTVYPDYNPNNGFMRGNIHKLTIGEYLYRMPGIITFLNYSINDQYPWEIKMDEPENGFDSDMMELPHLIDVSVSFKPIFNELPRTITRSNQDIGALISNKVGNIENFINKGNYIERPRIKTVR